MLKHLLFCDVREATTSKAAGLGGSITAASECVIATVFGLSGILALVFFPATVDGHLDKRALHAALPAVDTKYVSQVWIRQGVYSGQPSKRLDRIMGPALTKEEIAASGAGAVAGAGLFGTVNGHVMTNGQPLHQSETPTSQQSQSHNGPP